MLFLFTATTGWLATFLFGTVVSIPYATRALRSAGAKHFVRLWPHYWLGALVPAVAFFHAWLPMSDGHMRGFDMTGLLLATAALGVMLWQVGLGLSLRAAKGPTRRPSRQLHFWTMVLIAGLVATHIVLNRA
jgi:hypothetical protein